MIEPSDAELQAMQSRLRPAQPKEKEVKPIVDSMHPWRNLPPPSKKRPPPKPDAKAEQLKAREVHRKAINDGMITAGVPTLYRRWGLAIDFHDVLPNGADWSRRGYCLRGPTGNRKSSLAGALVRDRLRQMEEPSGVRMRWISVRSFCQRVKSASGNRTGETPWGIIQGVANLDLLVIDDLGKERDHDWDREIMGTMLWRAWDWGANFIITTQQTLKKFDGLDPALASRLGTLAEVDLGTKDWRQG